MIEEQERTQKMIEPTRLDASQLHVQLANCRLIVDVNQDLLDRNVPARDELEAKFRAAEDLLDQLKKPGENADHIVMLEDANLIVAEICGDIKLILSQDIP